MTIITIPDAPRSLAFVQALAAVAERNAARRAKDVGVSPDSPAVGPSAVAPGIAAALAPHSSAVRRGAGPTLEASASGSIPASVPARDTGEAEPVSPSLQNKGREALTRRTA